MLLKASVTREVFGINILHAVDYMQRGLKSVRMATHEPSDFNLKVMSFVKAWPYGLAGHRARSATAAKGDREAKQRPRPLLTVCVCVCVCVCECGGVWVGGCVCVCVWRCL